MSSELETYVALLRGINVGGKNKLAMKDLAATFVDAGCREVKTYIQSGNVVYTVPAGVARKAPGLVSERIAQRFGLEVPIVTRTAGELAAVAKCNPFCVDGADPSILQVLFLAELPDPGKAKSLDPGRSPPDSMILRGREIYLRCPNGFARTRFTNDYFDTRLATISTGRNWRTVLTLLELAQA
jgi:uncharacterized protein (DUF1697 family)